MSSRAAEAEETQLMSEADTQTGDPAFTSNTSKRIEKEREGRLGTVAGYVSLLCSRCSHSRRRRALAIHHDIGSAFLLHSNPQQFFPMMLSYLEYGIYVKRAAEERAASCSRMRRARYGSER